ncbi:MAG: hypothetical protein H8D74_01870 [Chloroflexi bacterium]|nr:hypothetical protein [Chloroflexota bacterium]
MIEDAQLPKYITIVDDAGRRKRQRVEYVVEDMKGEIVYVTREGLQYTRDALRRKRHYSLLKRLDVIPGVLTHPDIVIWDPDRKDTLLYYRRIYFPSVRRYALICAVIKVREGIKFLYNSFIQQSGKVKGHNVISAPMIKIWYIHPRKRPKQFGIR